MVTITEGTVQLEGDEWYTKTWLPEGRPVAVFVMVHGFSDHINCYKDFFPTLAGRGIACYGYDRRGWGRSVKTPAERGLTGPTATVVADIVAFLTSVLAQVDASLPVFVMGHSMGGVDVATVLATGTPGVAAYADTVLRRVRGWLLEAPFFGWPEGEAPSTLKIVAGRLAGRLLPHMHLKHVIPAEYLSRDPVVVETVRHDALCHDTGTLEGLSGLLDRVGVVAAGGCVPHAAVTSVWLGHGTADRATSYAASKAWITGPSAAGVADKTLRTYEGWYHQLHGEPKEDRELYYREVGDWVLARAKEATKEEAETAEVTETETAKTETETAQTGETGKTDQVDQPEGPIRSVL